MYKRQDYIFIYPFGMGIFGAVLATGFAPIISMLILSVHFRNKNCFRFKLKRPDLKLIGTIFSLGIPSLITELASGIVIIVFNIIIPVSYTHLDVYKRQEHTNY